MNKLLGGCIVILCLMGFTGCASSDQASQQLIPNLEKNDPGTVAKMYVSAVVSGECDQATQLVAFDYQPQVERVDCINNAPKSVLYADVSDVLVREMENQVVLVSLVGIFDTGKNTPMCSMELKVEKVNDEWYVIPHIMPGLQCTPIPPTPTIPQPTLTPAPSFVNANPLSDFPIHTLDGTIINSRDAIGKVIVIVSWRASCPYSKEFLPKLQKYYEKYSPELVVWALNYQDSPETIQEYIKENGLTFPIWLDPEGVITIGNGIDQWPSTLFIDREGNKVLAIIGNQSNETLTQIFQSLGFD
jgi:thiol-disulfide isomerase/thioredoxin